MIYERVIEYCKQERITVCDFEKKCGIGNGTVGKWRDDKASPSIKTLNKISLYTGLPIGHWISYEEASHVRA